ncbi:MULTISPECIES: class I SAM-dependent methyltransferase [Streptomyces]|uniref:Class I SAM-dependent methyltransferase n=1 Tax=Streptomyces sudanensis TaxID=436397 RepID=A0ABY4TF98_9ACTN|nr:MULTISPECIES: class I SAM-dependent methyltransferase [Streptomyces]MCP9958617.1 class I SAM-dependent methyltransferase [Streptomyces sudanensis]MCP9987717.1 class I SAM-dependent methyltransferase [Streptomyces sudanensis]MCQ0000881.1 class I SAM-dependent methyltransferase [Streptomyces sudanensis]URN16463.1 class I SAM-dependent methyltransferase [Streptomyces sudanensis]
MINASEIAGYWDAAAPSFDEEPDHGLRAERTHRAWDRFLRRWAPPGPADVLDIGCGTGSLSALLAAAGHRVTGVDLSVRMVEQAQVKLSTAGLPGRFVVGDAAAPPTGGEQFDLVLARHLLWTLPAPENALREWVARLRPGGTLLLVEGRWREAGQSGMPYVKGAETLPWNGGVLPTDLASAVEPLVASMRVENLSDTPDLWGRPVDDIRYALIAQV